jgi:hypothetical protein
MPSDRLTTEQLSRDAIYSIAEYVKYCYTTGDAFDIPASVASTLQHFDDLHHQPYSQPVFRAALEEGATLMASHSLALGEDDKERVHILASLADLGFFLEDGSVHVDFVV